MKTKNEILKLFTNEPLIEAGITHAMIDWESLLQSEGKSLFFGVGLCTAKEPAVAIPFDILSFFFIAERLKRFLKLSKIIVLIADTHALTNSFMTPELTKKLRMDMQQAFQKIIRNFSLPNFEILLSSDIRSLKTFRRVEEKLPQLENQYVQQELADIIWLSQNVNMGIKLGWTIDSSSVPSGHDERFFDIQLQSQQKLPISFIFTKAGRTLDENRPKASPYICIAGEKRITLTRNQLVPKISGAVKNHIANIVRLFEKTFVKLPTMTLEQKIQFICDIATQ